MKPADSYVADFVKGISRLKIVQAKSIMQPVEKFEKEFGLIDKNLESVHENILLNKLIEKSSIKDEPILVINNENKSVGVITQANLLKAVVEGSDGE
jgi:glycine betaine/proline transport system ATP-binding protein